MKIEDKRDVHKVTEFRDIPTGTVFLFAEEAGRAEPRFYMKAFCQSDGYRVVSFKCGTMSRVYGGAPVIPVSAKLVVGEED